MSFWDTSDGETITTDNTDTTFDGGGNFDPIPDGTVLVAAPTEAKWDEYDGEEYINLRWDVLDGEFKGRVIFHKVKVMSDNPKSRDRALRMLATIDANSGGKLLSVQGKPSDVQLASLCDKPMEIRVRIWDIDGKTGNWVEAVGKLGSLSGSSKPVTATAKANDKESFDDEIPF